MPAIDANNLALLAMGALVLLGVLSSALASRFGAPILFLFLVTGMLLGENGPGGIHFHDFGLAHLVASAALAIILFDGGLRTKARMFRAVLAPAGLLATLGVFVTALVVALAAMPLFGLSFAHAFLLGALVASTDAASMFFLVRTGGLRLRRRVNDTLEVESGTNDPLAIFLVLALVAALRPEGASEGVVWIFLEHMVLGAVFGVAGGFAIVVGLNRLTLPAGLAPVFVAFAALLVFAGTNLMHGSGFLAVYLAGIVVANRPARGLASVHSFTDAITWLAQIVMFTLLGLLATPARLLDILLPALGFVLVLMLIARPLAVVICLAPFRFAWTEQVFIAWVGLRGAVAIFLAILPVLAEVPAALVLFDATFLVVLVSLLVQGPTVRLAARLFGVALPGQDHPESRVELDLPGQLERELVGYPVEEHALYLRHPVLPHWAKLAFVMRQDVFLRPDEAGAIRAGDYVYLLAPPMQVGGLDRLFALTDLDRREEEFYFGEFVVPGEARLGDILAAYGAQADGVDAGQSVNALFRRRFGLPAVGDAVALGAIEIVAKTVEGEHVVDAGLRLEPEPAAQRLRRYARRLGLARG